MPIKKNYTDLPKSNKWDKKTHIEKLIRMLYLFQSQKYITKENIIDKDSAFRSLSVNVLFTATRKNLKMPESRYTTTMINI